MQGQSCFVLTGFNLTDQRGGVTRSNISLRVAMTAAGLRGATAQGFLVGANVNPFSVYGRSNMNGLSLARFMSVLLPFPEGSTIADRLTLQCDNAVSSPCTARIPLQLGGCAQISIGGPAGWAVTRDAADKCEEYY